MDLAPFQKRFLRSGLKPDITTACLSSPRGSGKSFLAARIAADAMRTLEPHQEIALAAASIEQARITFRFVRQMLGEDGFRYLDSSTRCAITAANGARLRVMGSNGKTAMGLVNTPLVIADEPGSWEANGGELMFDAISTAMGKPGSPLKAVFIGTLAPSLSGWWHDLVAAGSSSGRHVTLLQGRPERWSDFREVMRVNPLARVSPELRAQLKIELAEARRDSRLKSRFLSYRLNIPTRDAAEVLLTTADWKRVLHREVGEEKGRPVVGIDLGGGRSWSAAVAVWSGGRCEAVAVAPGVPSLRDQERADGVPVGLYERLHAGGRLEVADGLRIPPVRLLVDLILHHWGAPSVIVCDRFRLDDLRDARPPCHVSPRVTRWSDASSDIRALRKMSLDGNLSVEPSSRQLITASLSVSVVKSDDQGNTRLVKMGSNNKSRDDVAAALLLAAGEHARRAARPKARPLRVLVAGHGH